MMNRRTFLGTMAATGLWVRDLRGATGAHAISNLGAQLYTVRKEMKEDFDGTLAKVAAIGYREVEFAGYFDRDAKQVRASLMGAGLISPSTHVDYKNLGDKFPGILESAHTIGHAYIVCPWIEEKIRREPGGWQHVAETLNRAGEEARRAEIQFAYHNHAFEFEPIEGKLPYDVLLSETDPGLVRMEMDLYWIVKGGGDPLAYFSRYPGRFPLVHVKGRDPNGNMSPVAADNAIDWRAIFAQSGEAGIRHYFVEHDDPSSPLDSLRTSFKYLTQLRF
jgi:sugar phosphate isomerase/epimerase